MVGNMGVMSLFCAALNETVSIIQQRVSYIFYHYLRCLTPIELCGFSFTSLMTFFFTLCLEIYYSCYPGFVQVLSINSVKMFGNNIVLDEIWKYESMKVYLNHHQRQKNLVREKSKNYHIKGHGKNNALTWSMNMWKKYLK